jgi:hypothetical protein
MAQVPSDTSHPPSQVAYERIDQKVHLSSLQHVIKCVVSLNELFERPGGTERLEQEKREGCDIVENQTRSTPSNVSREPAKVTGDDAIKKHSHDPLWQL